MSNKRYLLLLLGVMASASMAASGDSADPAYAHSVEKLVGSMSESQREYYYQTFDYAMQHLKPGDKQDWATGTDSGSFAIDKTFVHNDTVCRSFREMVGNTQMYSISSEGVGCKRVGRDGWCKLKKGDALTCAMEPPDNQIVGQVDDLERGVENTNTEVRSAIYHWWSR